MRAKKICLVISCPTSKGLKFSPNQAKLAATLQGSTSPEQGSESECLGTGALPLEQVEQRAAAAG